MCESVFAVGASFVKLHKSPALTGTGLYRCVASGLRSAKKLVSCVTLFLYTMCRVFLHVVQLNLLLGQNTMMEIVTFIHAVISCGKCSCSLTLTASMKAVYFGNIHNGVSDWISRVKVNEGDTSITFRTVPELTASAHNNLRESPSVSGCQWLSFSSLAFVLNSLQKLKRCAKIPPFEAISLPEYSSSSKSVRGRWCSTG